MATNMVLARGGTPMATVEEGADAVMHLITSPDVGTGQYFNQTRATRANAQAYDAESRRRLRELSLRLVGIE